MTRFPLTIILTVALGAALATGASIALPGQAHAQAAGDAPATAATEPGPKAGPELAPPASIALGPPTVLEIKFDGLLRVDETGLRRRLQSRAGQPLDPGALSQDIRRVFQMNFFEDVRAEAEDRPDGIVLWFVVKERPAIRKVLYQGNDEVDLEDIEKVVDIPKYEIVNVPKINRNLRKIREVYQDEGFHLAEVNYELVPVSDNLVDLRFRIIERAKIKVKRITFLGNQALSDDELRGAMMGTREGSFFSFLTRSGMFKREYFAQDLRILKDFYAQHGYIKARIDDPVVTLSRDQEFLYITIHVVEGRRYRVGEVNLTGDFIGDDQEELAPKLKLEKGEWFNTAAVRADTQIVGGRYRDKGYAYANVSSDYRLREPQEGEDAPVIDFTYVLQKGTKVRFGEVRMAGNASTRDLVLRRELAFGEGDWYSETAIKRSRAKIMRLGFFDNVDIKTRRGARDDLVDVVVEVSERQTGTFQIGAGFSSFESFLATAQISKQNFLGRGQTVSFMALLSSLRTQFRVNFYEPHLFNSDFSFSLNVYNFSNDLNGYSSTSSGGSVAVGYWLTDEIIARLTYKLEHLETDMTGMDLAHLFQNGLQSSVQAALIYDSRDDRMFPTTGWYGLLSAEHAPTWLGSEQEFTNLTFRGNRYFRLPLGMVFKLNLTAGWVMSPQKVPISQRFRLGGIFSVRGYERYSLGDEISRGCQSSPEAAMCQFNQGGTKQLVANAELEFPILPKVGIKGVFFLDAGNAFAEEEAIDILGLRTSWGFGVRWHSPMGPLRFEWGFPIDRRAGEDRYVFEFTIGNAF